MILWVTVLTLSGILGVMPSVLADEDERTTAKDVVDSKTDMEYQDNLKKFVLSARDYFLSLPLSELLGLADILREEGGDWNYKSMYLVVLFADGTVYSHGEDPSKDGTDISNAVDDNGKEVVKEILAVVDADEEGGFVEYTWDDPSTDEDVNPRVCYAIKGGHPAFPGQEFILVGGYHHNVTSTEDETEALPEFPEVSAQDVRDRETLKAFVQGAGDWALRALPTLSFDLPKLETEFRREGGHWRHGSTYIFAMTPDGTVIFHGSPPDQEDLIRIDLEDRNGFQFVRALIDAAVDEEASGYVEYYWNDPGVTGDEEFGSAKVGYAEAVTLPNDYAIFPGATIVIGSGFYKGGQVALDFAHFANGGGITSDIVLLNAAAKPVRPAIYFYDMDGERIAPEFVMDLTDNLEVKSYGALTVNEEIPSLGELTISTHGRGTKVVVGSVKVVSDAPDSPIGGVLRFDLTGTGVAGVGASQPVRDAIFPARRVAGGINTGAAFRNLSESRMELTCRLMMGGEVLEEQPVDLPANGQRPQFINQIFEETDTSDFTGSVRCMAPPGDQQFTAVALELEDRKVFTTLPVISLEGEMPSGDEMMSEE
jgi:hypothetical protein